MPRTNLILLLLLLLAFALRLAYWERSAQFGHYELSYDDDEYYKASILFTKGEWLRDPYPLRYTRSPGYPLFLAAIFAPAGPQIEIALLIQVGVSVLTVALVYVTARRAFGQRAGLAAAGLMALAPTYASLAGSFLLTETLFAFCILLFLYLFWRWAEEGLTLPRALIVGIILGLSALVRGQALYFFPIAAVWFLITTRPRWGFALARIVVAVIGIALVIAPWTARNAMAYQRFILLDTNSGWTIWRDHRVPDDDFWVTLPRITNPGDRASYATARGVANILADPVRQLGINGLANLAYLPHLELDSFARGDGYLSDVIVDAPTLGLAALNDIFFLAVVLLGIAGILLTYRRAPSLLLLWLAFTLLMTFLFHTQSRFRAHYLFVLVIFAGAALAAFPHLWRALNLPARAILVGAAALVLLLAYSPRLAPLIASEYHLARAQGTNLAELQAATAAFPEYAAAYDALGDAYRRVGDRQSALDAYGHALQINTFELQARLGRIDIFRQEGNTRRAAAEVRAASGANSELDIPAPLWWDFDPAPARKIEVGDPASSFGYIMNFHAPEREGDESFRWTQHRSFVKFTGVRNDPPHELVIYGRAVVPENQSPPAVDVWINGIRRAPLPLTTNWEEHSILLDDSLQDADKYIVEFRSPTFRPIDVFPGSTDTRDLGFMLGSLELR